MGGKPSEKLEMIQKVSYFIRKSQKDETVSLSDNL